MANKINTNFVIILVLAIVCGAGIVGALLFLRPTDASRNIRHGDEALAAGDLQRAFDQYGRAVNKDPGNPEYLAKMESTLLQMRPDTADRAGELYGQRVGILRHAANHNYNDATAHLRVLDELLGAARRLNSAQLWDMLASAATDMLQQLPETNPERIRARIYRSHALFRLAQLRTTTELTEALRDVEDVVRVRPDDDLGWATLVWGQLVMIEKLRLDGALPSALDEQTRKAFEAADKAEEHMAGPETARILAACLVLRRSLDPALVSDEQIAEHIARLEKMVTVQSDSALVSETAEVLNLLPGGDGVAQRLLERYLDAHPEAHDKRLALGLRHYRLGELDEAERMVRQILDAQPMTVSFWASLQFDLKRGAGSLLVDIEHRRWEQAGADEKAERVAAMQKARDALARIVPDEKADPLLTRADGKIAYARGEYTKAAALFDRLADSNDPDALLYAAWCLHRIGQPGRAYERLTAASALNPRQEHWQIMKAGLEVELGKFEQAEKTLASLSPEMQKQDQVRQIRESMERQRRIAAVDDPLRVALQTADAALARRDYEAARAALQTIDASTNPEALIVLARIELTAGNREAALALVTRGAQAFPQVQTFKNLKTSLAHEDPIEGVRALLNETISNPDERRISMLVHMIAMNEQQEVTANRMQQEGREAEAAEARELAARAAAERDRWLEQVRNAMPDHPVLVDIQFMAAVRAKDWAQAEQAVARAKRLNADQADGEYYRGRLEAIRGNPREAIRAFEAATERAGFLALLWRDLGLVYQSQGNLTQAQRAFEQAYRCNPNDLSIVGNYVGVLQLRGDTQQARAILQTAHQLAPTNVVIREMWLLAEAQSGSLATAMRTRREIFKSMTADDERLARDDLVNAMQLAKLLSQTEPTRELMLDSSNNPTYTEQRWARMDGTEQSTIIARVKSEWHAEAKSILDRLERDVAAGRVKPDVVRDVDLELNLAYERASLLRVTGQVVEGERVLQEFMARRGEDKKTAATLLVLGRYQSDVNHFADAIATYQEALPLQDDQKREVDAALSELYMRLNMPAEALPHLEAQYEVRPDSSIKNQIIACLIEMRRLEDADRNIRELRTADAANAVTTMLEATLAQARAEEALARGDVPAAERMYAQQRDALARAESQDPTNPTPHVQLAQSLYREYTRSRRDVLLQDALIALDRAERLRPGVAEIALTRTQVLLAKGDRTSAINELRRVLERSPQNVPARRELVAQYVGQRDGEMAFRIIEEGIRQNPTLAIWYEVKGDVHKMFPELRDRRAAIEAYDKADQLSPSPMSLLKVVDALTGGRSPGECAEAVKRVDARPSDLEAMPLLRQFYARALLCAGRRDDALAQARLAYEARRKFNEEHNVDPADILEWFSLVHQLFPADDPAAAEAFVMDVCGQSPDIHVLRGMSRIWWNSGSAGLSRAIELQRQALARSQDEKPKLKAAVNLELAHYLLAAENTVEAASVYETVIRLDPDNAGALNNLAYLWAEEMNDATKALEYAQRVLPLAPNDASVLDTVGWVYYRAGNAEKAAEHLNRSLTIQPTADAHFHLAWVYWSQGDAAQAKWHVDAAVELKPDPKTRQKLDRLADDIQQGRKP